MEQKETMKTETKKTCQQGFRRGYKITESLWLEYKLVKDSCGAVHFCF